MQASRPLRTCKNLPHRCPCLARRPTPNGKKYAKGLNWVRVREKRSMRFASWRTTTFARFSTKCCECRAANRRGFACSRSAGRTLEECKRIEEDNAEFHLALLDRRFLAGDSSLFEKLDEKVLPGSEKQARPFMLAQLHKLTRDRLTRYGNTIFHLEPNVKESPGGMRDYQATIWLRQLAEEKKGIRNITAAEEEMCSSAVDFLSATRCFLHYTNGRNDNTLTYELQEASAEHALGIGDGVARTPSDWMRQYFRHARTLNRQLLRYLEQKAPVPLTLRQRLRNAARASRVEAGDGKYFQVRDGLLEVVDLSALSDRAITYS